MANFLYSPWIGLVTLTDILLLLNFSKIPVARTFYKTSFLNGLTFAIFITLFLIFVNLIYNFPKIIKLINKKNLFYSLIMTVAILIIFLFLSPARDISLIKKADQLKNLSIMEDIFVQKSLSKSIWQVGPSIIVAFVSTLFKISTTEASKILQAIFSVSSAFLLWHLLSRFKNKSTLLRLLFLIVALIFLYLLEHFAVLNTVLLTGAVLFLFNLLFDQTSLLRSRKKLLYLEEFLVALTLIFLASINSLVYRLGIILPVIFFSYNIFRNKKITWYWLRSLIFMLLLNPLLVGLALRF